MGLLLHNAKKNIENGEMGKKINMRLHGETDFTGVTLDSIYSTSKDSPCSHTGRTL